MLHAPQFLNFTAIIVPGSHFKHLSQIHYFGNILDVHTHTGEHSVTRIIHAVIQTGIL